MLENVQQVKNDEGREFSGIKCLLPTKEGRCEGVWVEIKEIIVNTAIGILRNQPVEGRHEYGDTVLVQELHDDHKPYIIN
ncbi:MAG: hypothetical protein ACE5OZ_07395 [Candidatus Heimdallarchaeota archaeon]